MPEAKRLVKVGKLRCQTCGKEWTAPMDKDFLNQKCPKHPDKEVYMVAIGEQIENE